MRPRRRLEAHVVTQSWQRMQVSLIDRPEGRETGGGSPIRRLFSSQHGFVRTNQEFMLLRLSPCVFDKW